MLTINDLTETELDAYEERLSIRIIDGHQTEAEAQRGALEDIQRRRDRMGQGRLI